MTMEVAIGGLPGILPQCTEVGLCLRMPVGVTTPQHDRVLLVLFFVPQDVLL